MQDYLIDTNHINPIHRGDDKVWQKIRTLPHERKWIISPIVLGEIQAGQQLAVASDPVECKKLLTYIDERFCVLPSPVDLAVNWGQIVARIAQNHPMKPGETIEVFLARNGVQINDAWLVAEAWSHGLVVVTHDKMTLIREAVEQPGDVRFDDWLA